MADNFKKRSQLHNIKVVGESDVEESDSIDFVNLGDEPLSNSELF